MDGGRYHFQGYSHIARDTDLLECTVRSQIRRRITIATELQHSIIRPNRILTSICAVTRSNALDICMYSIRRLFDNLVQVLWSFSGHLRNLRTSKPPTCCRPLRERLAEHVAYVIPRVRISERKIDDAVDSNLCIDPGRMHPRNLQL